LTQGEKAPSKEQKAPTGVNWEGKKRGGGAMDSPRETWMREISWGRDGLREGSKLQYVGRRRKGRTMKSARTPHWKVWC